MSAPPAAQATSSPAPPLRRADWRFLLPLPGTGEFRHVVVSGGPPGLAAKLQEFGLAPRVSTAIPKDSTVDAVILLAGSEVTCEAAAAALADDGVFYWEADRRSLSALRLGSRSIERRVQRAGLMSCGMFWVIPDFSEARRYLPLDSSSAVQWFFDTRFVASTPARRALAAAVRIAALGGPRALAALAPCIGVVARKRARAIGVGARIPRGDAVATTNGSSSAPVLFTSGQDDGSRLVMLCIGAGETAPSMVIKRARMPGFDALTAAEQQSLHSLRLTLPSALRTSLPEPLGNIGTALEPRYAESALSGQMLAASIGRWGASAERRERDLESAASWLLTFHQATVDSTAAWDTSLETRWITRPMERFTALFGERPAEQRLFDLARARSRDLMGVPLPIVSTHRDFNPWHVYRAGNALGVIDWESSDPSDPRRLGLPVCDLVYFLNSWAHLSSGAVSGADKLHVFEELALFAEVSDRRRVAAERVLRAYIDGLSLDRRFYPLLFLATWVDRATDQGVRRRSLGDTGAATDASPAAPSDDDNIFAQYVDALGRRGTRLFDGRLTGPGVRP